MIRTIEELFKFTQEKDEILERLDHILGLFPLTYFSPTVTDWDCCTDDKGAPTVSVTYDETIRGCTDSNNMAEFPAAWLFMSDEEIIREKAEMDAENKQREEERKQKEAMRLAEMEREQELKTLARLKAKYDQTDAGA